MNTKTKRAPKTTAIANTGIAALAQGLALPAAPTPDKPSDTPVVSKSVIPSHYRKQYKTFRADEQRTSGGNPTINNGDKVAMALLGKTVKEVFEYVAGEMSKLDNGRGITVAYLEKKYEGKNDGMKRMNAGNILRNTIKRIAAEPKAN